MAAGGRRYLLMSAWTCAPTPGYGSLYQGANTPVSGDICCEPAGCSPVFHLEPPDYSPLRPTMNLVWLWSSIG